MVSKTDLRRQEEKLGHLLGQRREHQDELVTAQVELRHASGDLTRLLAEGVLQAGATRQRSPRRRSGWRS